MSRLIYLLVTLERKVRFRIFLPVIGYPLRVGVPGFKIVTQKGSCFEKAARKGTWTAEIRWDGFNGLLVTSDWKFRVWNLGIFFFTQPVVKQMQYNLTEILFQAVFQLLCVHLVTSAVRNRKNNHVVFVVLYIFS